MTTAQRENLSTKMESLRIVPGIFHGKRHRIDGPAREQFSPDGTLEVYGWHFNGKKHREDGPAYESFIANDGPVAQYWLNGVNLSKEEYQRRTSLRKLSLRRMPGEITSL